MIKCKNTENCFHNGNFHKKCCSELNYLTLFDLQELSFSFICKSCKLREYHKKLGEEPIDDAYKTISYDE